MRKFQCFFSRLYFLYPATAIFICLSPKLWQIERTIPAIPLFDKIAIHNHQISVLLSQSLVVLLVLIPFIRVKKYMSLLSILLLAVLIVSDVHRMQPYILMSLFFLSGLTICEWINYRKGIFNTFRWLLIGMYIWGGIHKLNEEFLYSVGPWLMQNMPFFKVNPIAIPLVEIFAGTMLIFSYRMIKRTGVILALSIHIGIIIMFLTPGNEFSNLIITYWNLWMLPLPFILFWWQEQENQYKSGVNDKFNTGKQIVILILLVFPSLKLLGFSHNYFSWALYCEKPIIAILGIEQKYKHKGLIPSNAYLFTKNGIAYYNLDHISSFEMGVQPFWNENIRKETENKIRNKLKLAPESLLITERKLDLSNNRDYLWTVVYESL